MPAIITALAPDEGAVHLHPFPPPGYAVPIMDREWGIPQAVDDREPRFADTWRWPERVE